MKTLKIFFSKTTRPRASIMGMKHHLEDLYQVCSNYPPWAKNGPVPVITCFSKAYIGKTGKIYLYETIRPRDLIIRM